MKIMEITKHTIERAADPNSTIRVGDLKPGDVFSWASDGTRAPDQMPIYMVLNGSGTRYAGVRGETETRHLIPTLKINSHTGLTGGWISWHPANHVVAKVYTQCKLILS